ncbi:MAG: PC4/YdbC family ssDNA-binding protein [Tissierellaceae bacterium]|nr:PC4/YdbC family ssDNA-binding protein [Tissierellaceae bacterium]
MAEVTFEITKSLGVLSESPKGWTKEINLVSWNKYPAKYDIREWDPDHEKMSKGITFTAEEIKELRDILNGIDL